MLGHVAGGSADRFAGIAAFLAGAPTFGVHVFFAISGFVVPWSLFVQRYELSDFPRYLARRLVRLDPPYIAAVALGAALVFVRSRRSGVPFPFTGVDLALHLGYLSGLARHQWVLPVFWTLGIEFQFYVLAGLLFPAIMSAESWWVSRSVRQAAPDGRVVVRPSLRGLGEFVIVFVFAQAIVLLLNRFFNAQYLWSYYWLYFFVGLLLFLVRAKGLHWVAVVALFVVVRGIDGPSSDWAALFGVALLVMMAPPTLPWLRTTIVGRCLNGLGHISYSLYLVHLLTVGSITQWASRRWGVFSAPIAVGVFASEVALCLVLATAFYFVLEAPAIRLSRRIVIRGRA